MPDVDSLRVGDLLLAQRLELDVGTAVILGVQATRGQGAVWSHAAIYAGEWRLFEANPKTNISTGRLDAWVPNTRILVRRPTAFMQDGDEAQARLLGAKLALEAAMMQTTGIYGSKSLLDVGMRLLGNLRPNPRPMPPEMMADGIICSGLYAKCYAIVAGGSLMSAEQIRTDEPVTPELLSRVTSLQTLEVGWRKLIA